MLSSLCDLQDAVVVLQKGKFRFYSYKKKKNCIYSVLKFPVAANHSSIKKREYLVHEIQVILSLELVVLHNILNVWKAAVSRLLRRLLFFSPP